MSYILDALQKAERERQRGAVPTLQPANQLPVASRRTPYLLFGAIALLLMVAGVLLGWWQPWNRPTKPPLAAPVPAAAVALLQPAAQTSAPAPVQAVIPAPSPVPVAPPMSVAQPAMQGGKSALTTPPVEKAAPAEQAVPAEKPVVTPPRLGLRDNNPEAPVALADLPAELRQEIPVLNVMVHSYSSIAKDRLVIINNKPMHEGEALAPGLTLEEITSDGMIFSLRGHRFKAGVH